MATNPLIDPRALREAFGTFMTGVVIVTSRSPDGTPIGFTANSFSSVSLDPPMLLVCPGKFLTQYQNFTECSHFAVSILNEEQEAVSNAFAGRSTNRFAETQWHCGPDNMPLITDALAHFSCRREQSIVAGDHAVLLGEITAFNSTPGLPLGYHRGTYVNLTRERDTAASAARQLCVGALLHYGETVFCQADGSELSLPALQVLAGANPLDTLQDHLNAMGIVARLGQVYSVFQDQQAGQEHCYYLAQLDPHRSNVALTAVEQGDLCQRPLNNPAIASMVKRYLSEVKSGGFSLYLGDEERGDLHDLNLRRT